MTRWAETRAARTAVIALGAACEYGRAGHIEAPHILPLRSLRAGPSSSVAGAAFPNRHDNQPGDQRVPYLRGLQATFRSEIGPWSQGGIYTRNSDAASYSRYSDRRGTRPCGGYPAAASVLRFMALIICAKDYLYVCNHLGGFARLFFLDHGRLYSPDGYIFITRSIRPCW